MGLSLGQHDKLGALLQQYHYVFIESSELPPNRSQDHKIPLLPRIAPLRFCPCCYSFTQKNQMERMVGKMLVVGLIQPSHSPFSSSVLLVRMKDGNWCFCVDYHQLNKVTISDKYPLPVIQEMLEELCDTQFFRKLDLRSGYHQIRVAMEDIPKTASDTHSSHYEFMVMPFGLTNAPSTFQATINDLFRPHLRRFVPVFFDDIWVYSPSWSLHLDHLHALLRILQVNQFKVNKKNVLSAA